MIAGRSEQMNAKIPNSGWQLKSLTVSGPSFTDEDIGMFADFSRLESLSMIGTKVTANGIDLLKTLKPSIRVYGYFPGN